MAENDRSERKANRTYRRILSRRRGETIRRAPGGRLQRCRDAPTLLRRACRSAAAATRLVEPGQPLPQLLAEAVGGKAGAVEAEAEGEHAEDGLRVGEGEECVVIVGVSGWESADRGRVRLGALGGVGVTRVCQRTAGQNHSRKTQSTILARDLRRRVGGWCRRE